MCDIKAFRVANKLTQLDLANYLGTTKSFISLVETGRSKLSSRLFSSLLNNTEGWDTSLLKCEHESDKDQQLSGIPLVSATAIGGFGNFDFSIQANDIKGMYIVPKFQDKKIDFMIEVVGSSMYPKYNSGDVVACRIIRESQFIQWNKVHIVATREQGILVKRLKPSQNKGCILAVSDNKNYDPFDIPLDEIEGLAIVVGVIRLE